MASSSVTTEIKERKRNQSPIHDRPNMSDLRIVLLGTSISENSRVRNLIFNKCVFVKKTPSSDVEEFSESVEGRNITVISTDLLKSELKLQTATEKALELSQFYPHVIILVLQYSYFDQHQRDLLSSVLIYFGEQPMKRTMILTTDDKIHSSKQQSGKENEFIHQLSTECGGGRLQLQNTQRSQILQNVDKIITHSGYQDTSLNQGNKCKREHSPPGERPNMSDLRIVLLGTRLAENYTVGNLILNKNMFVKKATSSDVEEFSERVEGRNITVISTCQLLNPELKIQTLIQKASALSSPEPQVIILVLQHSGFSKKQRNRLYSVLDCFGEQAIRHTMILTTDDVPCETDLKSVQENEFIQEISTECGGGRLQLQNTQHSQILKNINEMITLRQSSSVDQEDRSSSDSDDQQLKQDEGHKARKGEVGDLRIVLLGKNVSENSRVRNLILGIDLHETAPHTPIQKYNVLKISGTVNDRHVMVINTLHLLSPNTSDHQITQTVRECVETSAPGPHAFMIILQYKDFTEKNMRTVHYVLNKFSEDAIEHTIIITTDKERDSPMEVNPAISQLTNVCSGRHSQLEERKPEWPAEILNIVDMMLKDTPEYYLTCEVFEDSEEPSRSLDSSRLEEENNDDEKPKQSKRSEGTLIDVREWIRTNSPANISGKKKLNLVLCGSNESLTVSVSKLLRGKRINTSHQRASIEECAKKEKIHGRQISLLELPTLSRLSEDKVMRQTLRCVSLCDLGVHAFLLIIPVGPLTDRDKAEIEKIYMKFYSKQHFITILVSNGAVQRPDFIQSSSECQELISRYGGLYCVIDLKKHENSRQIPELLGYIDKKKTEPYSLQMYVKAQETRTRREEKEKYEEELKRMEKQIKGLQEKGQSEGSECSDDQKCLRIVLIGRTGNGKSATGNTILGRKEFHSQSSMDSVTTDCMKGVGEVDGQSVAVVDTPGLFDTTMKNDQVVEEIVKCVSLSAPGPHVFVIVLSVGRFTKEEADTVDLIKKIFGHKAAQFSIVLFTRGDDLEDQSIEDYVEKGNNAELKKLIRDCGNRILTFNNKEKQDRTQVIQLLKMIEEVKTNNQGRYFTNSMFEEAEMSIKKRMEEIMKEREREIQKEREELQAKYEMETETLKKRLEEEKQRAEEERMKMENQYREKEEKLRKESEEKEKADQEKRETEKQKRLEEEKQQRAEYDQRIEEIKREIDNQRSQYEKQQKQREEEDRRREEEYRRDQEKMKSEQERIIAEVQRRQEEETTKRDYENRKRNQEEEAERQRWERKIKEAENEREDTREEIKRQQREWEDEKRRQMKEREEEERKRKEKHEEQLREKQEELEKMRRRFEGERDEERQKMEDERQKQRREREEKEREYEEKKQKTERHYERLERERKEEWERRKLEDEERREEERKRWKKMIEDLKQEQEDEKKKRDTEEKERQNREERERDEMKKKHENEMSGMKKKHEDEARKQAEEFNNFKEENKQQIEELKQTLEEHQQLQEILEKLYQLQQLPRWFKIDPLKKDVGKLHERLQVEKGDELKTLLEEVEKLLEKQKNKKCAIM